jgi:D-alanyl-D-alanine carboxypeptidase
MTFDPLLTDARPGPTAGRGPEPRPRWPGSRGALVALALSALVALGVLVAVRVTDDEDATTTSVVTTSTAVPGPAAPGAGGPPVTRGTPVTTTPSIDAPGSRWWLVNRDRPLPPGYVPADLVVPDVPLEPDAGAIELTAETAAAFGAMAADARTAGYELQLTSGYRSEQDQQVLYDRFVEDFGRDVAAGLVALPGTSEHQTGLAADVGLVGLPDDQVFGATPASAWVAANAHRFGFILRYPPDKAAITGYANEPWHLRYVGTDLAAELHASGLTMEEHFGLVPT